VPDRRLAKFAPRLYHFNPWQDTAHGMCNSFQLYRQQPVNFFMQRFTGMTRPVAEYLTSKVFCILDDPKDDLQRVDAREFGIWIKDLPALLAETSASGHKRAVLTSLSQGFPIASSVPPSRRLSSGQSINVRGHAADYNSRPHTPSLSPTYEADPSELSTIIDQEEEQDDEGMRSRSTPGKRRKRGARKGKGPRDPVASSASSIASSDWRNSTSDAMSSSSAFTRYSNNSFRSLSTQATSVSDSASSWRTADTTQSKRKNQPPRLSTYSNPEQRIPKNIKSECYLLVLV